MTAKKIAARHLWNAGKYLERVQRENFWPLGMTRQQISEHAGRRLAIQVIVAAYNQVLGDSHVSRTQPL